MDNNTDKADDNDDGELDLMEFLKKDPNVKINHNLSQYIKHLQIRSHKIKEFFKSIQQSFIFNFNYSTNGKTLCMYVCNLFINLLILMYIYLFVLLI